MKASRQQDRMTALGPAEAHPHQRSTAYYRRALAHQQRSRVSLAGMQISVTAGSFKPYGRPQAGRYNATVAAVRNLVDIATDKQPGRRYGPSPQSTTSGRGARMSNRRRRAAYMAQNGREAPLTARQYRRIERTTTARIA